MTHACQLTEIPRHDFPELLQFYQHFPEKYPFLLSTSSKKKSLQSDTTEGFDILFIEPQQWLKLDHQLKLSASSGIEVHEDDFFLDAFDTLFASEKSQTSSVFNDACNTLPFRGGWFMFLAYELAQQIEPCLKLTFEPQALPVAYAARVKQALIYDHCQEKLFFLSEAQLEHDKACHSVLQDAAHIVQSADKSASLNRLQHGLSEENSEIFLNSVDKVRHYIKEGDVFQVNLSRLWQASFSGSEHTQLACGLAEILSEENPAPFSGLADFTTGNEQGTAAIISSSPERLLKVHHNRLESRPIAGTRPRSSGKTEDSRLLNELHAHPKEQAEHIMLIDLIRNDLGRVCQPGSVKVDELMVNESYAHVHHIVSNVSGALQDNTTPGQIIKAMFPGGTITGCPKVHCMDIIAELEQQSRGAYTGSMGYVNLDGSMDLNILIRTMVLETVVLETVLETAFETEAESQSADNREQHKLTFRAGAGLVFDSIADKELQETRAKAKGLLRALATAGIHE